MRALRRCVALERCGSVPYRAAKLNSRKRYIGSFELQTTHDALYRLVLISTLDRFAVDRNEQNAKKERKKEKVNQKREEASRKDQEKYGDDEG